MPRINVTDEELKLLETIRQKNATTLGYNEGLDIAARLIETKLAIDVISSEIAPQLCDEFATHLRSMKREIVR